MHVTLSVSVTCFDSVEGPKPNDCNPHYRSPTGPFWATFNVTFVGSEFYSSIINKISDYDLENRDVVAKWMRRLVRNVVECINYINHDKPSNSFCSLLLYYD